MNCDIRRRVVAHRARAVEEAIPISPRTAYDFGIFALIVAALGLLYLTTMIAIYAFAVAIGNLPLTTI